MTKIKKCDLDIDFNQTLNKTPSREEGYKIAFLDAHKAIRYAMWQGEDAARFLIWWINGGESVDGWEEDTQWGDFAEFNDATSETPDEEEVYD